MSASSSSEKKEEKIDVFYLRQLAKHIANQVGVPDSADELTDKDLIALAMMSHSKTHDPKYDKRFPNCNQSANCWTAVNEYQLCVKKTGDFNDQACRQRRRDFLTLCPSEWVEEWQTQIEDGNFFGVGDFLGPPEEEEDEESEGEDGEEEEEDDE